MRGTAVSVLALLGLTLGAGLLRAGNNDLPHLAGYAAPATFKVAILPQDLSAYADATKAAGVSSPDYFLLPWFPLETQGSDTEVSVKDFGSQAWSAVDPALTQFDRYVLGVVIGELGIPSLQDASVQPPDEAIKAQMVAVRSYIRSRLVATTIASVEVNSVIYSLKSGGAAANVNAVGLVTGLKNQRALPFVDPEYLLYANDHFPWTGGITLKGSLRERDRLYLARLTKTAKDIGSVRVALGSSDSGIDTEWFAHTSYQLRPDQNLPDVPYQGFTRSSEETVSAGNYDSNKRMVPSPDGALIGHAPPGHGRGMSQEGAKLLAAKPEAAHSALQILQHYYGPTAPILRSAELWQGDVLKYRTAWRDLPSARGSSDDVLGNFRQQVITANQPLNLTDPIQMKLRFTEDMDDGFLGIGQALGITVSSHNKVTECLEGSTYASCSAERFELTVTPQKLFEWLDGETGTARAGTVTVRVTARHQDVNSFLLDADPRTLAVKDLNLTPTRGNT